MIAGLRIENLKEKAGVVMENEQHKKNAVQIYNELLEARTVIARQQRELDQICGSTCWRLTKPYRVIGTAVSQTVKRTKDLCGFCIYSMKKVFWWMRQFGLAEGIKMTKDHVGRRIHRMEEKSETKRLADSSMEWKEFADWLAETPHSFIDIFSVPMGWNTKLFQRFQHISLNAGRIHGIAVYGAHPDVDHGVKLYKFVNPELCIVNLNDAAVKKRMFHILDQRKELKYIRIQSIDLMTTIEEVQEYLYKGYYIVYEYIDELAAEITSRIPSFVYDRHEFLLKNLRVVVAATSDKLYKQALAVRGSRVNLELSTNGVDYDYWKAERTQYEIPKELQEIVGCGKIIIGYHGALAKWVDYAALENIARNEQYILLLIGYEHDESLRSSGILNRKNICYLGPKPYEELVRYAVWYDVAILPFIVNDITLAVSPVKIFEYMALQKPIVAGPLPECRKYKSCIIAESAEEYADKVKYAYALKNDAPYLQTLLREAQENTWESIAKRTVQMVRKCKEYEEEILGLKTEENLTDLLNPDLDSGIRDLYMNQVLHIPSGRKSAYYKSLTQSPYQRQKGDCRIIAYYLTQFHPDSHNEAWWGKGVTEWNHVARAVPQYAGHYQPRMPGELGYYDLRLKEVMKRQAGLAQMYGIYGFSFYYYWFDGERLLEQPLEMFLENRDIDIPFSLCWANENWTKRFDGTNTDILMEQPSSVESYKNVIHDMIRFLKDSRYIEINGKKMITVYRPSLMPKVKEVLDYWRKSAAEQGLGELYLIAVKENMIDVDWCKKGYDALSEFHPGTIYAQCLKINSQISSVRKDFSGEVFSYEDLVRNKKYFNYSLPKLYRSVMPMWDNTARRDHQGMIFQGAVPVLYKEWLKDVIWENEAKKNVDDNIVFINAWNEWGEGAYLEPDGFYGYAYLNATKEAVEECRETNISGGN